MTQSNIFGSLDIAYEFIERAQQLSDRGKYGEAYSMLDKAESYAFSNTALLDNIRIRRESIRDARQQYIRRLEESAADIFSREPFKSQEAHEALQILLQEDSDNQLAKSLWEELPIKEAAERERHLVEGVERKLTRIWDNARDLEEIGAGRRIIDEYEQALLEASKAAGDTPASIPLQKLKAEAQKRRDTAKEKWEGTPTLILDQKGQELVERFKALKAQGEVSTEFFDENGDFVGRLPVDECIQKAEDMASRFAEQKADNYLGQANDLLETSPGAARDKINEALAFAYLSDLAQKRLERELEEKINPAISVRKTATEMLNGALHQQDVEKAWTTLQDVERTDPYTPGIESAYERLHPLMLYAFDQLLEEGEGLREIEDFANAHDKLQEAKNTAQRFLSYSDGFQNLLPKAQDAIERCRQEENDAIELEKRLSAIADISHTEPELALEDIRSLEKESKSSSAKKKIDRVRIEVEFRLGIEQTFRSLEQRMLSAKDDIELIPIEEAVKQVSLDYPGENRFQRLSERVEARRSYLKACRLKEDPAKRLDAQELLRLVIDQNGDDAIAAQLLVDEISASEQQETDINIAIEEAKEAFKEGDARLAFLRLEPYRYAVSRQSSQLRQLISKAVTQWQEEVERQLTDIVKIGDFNLAKVEVLLNELERSQSPRLDDWKGRVLAPAYASAAIDLQELARWEQSNELWEKAFRLAPTDPRIVDGRRNAQKHRALRKAQITIDPSEKEQILNNANNTYADDLTVKRHLAEFYYSQERYKEARMAITQAVFLSDKVTPELSKDVEAVRVLDSLIQESEEIERHKLRIASRIAGHTMISDLWDAREASHQLGKEFPNHEEKLRIWWSNITRTATNGMNDEIAKLSERAGTVWERTELSCKILALQDDEQIRRQAERLLKLTYNQTPKEIETVINNPLGEGFGLASESLTKHISATKKVQKRLISMGQAEQIFTNLGIDTTNESVNLEKTLFDVEIVLEKLYTAQLLHRRIKEQVEVAIITGEWDSIEDGLKELESIELNDHRGVKILISEVEGERKRRNALLAAAETIVQAIQEEKFEMVEEKLQFLEDEDEADETMIRSSLQVVDPFTKRKIEDIAAAVSAKLAIINTLAVWNSERQPIVDWTSMRDEAKKLATHGSFKVAINLCQTASGDNNDNVTDPETWSFGRLKQHLTTPPVTQEEINSFRAQETMKGVFSEVETINGKIEECRALESKLEEDEAEFTRILDDLKHMLEILDTVKGPLSFLKERTVEVQNAKEATQTLLEEGRKLCPSYSVFEKLEDNYPLLRR